MINRVLYDVKDLRDLRVYATTGPRDLRETPYDGKYQRETRYGVKKGELIIWI